MTNPAVASIILLPLMVKKKKLFKNIVSILLCVVLIVKYAKLLVFRQQAEMEKMQSMFLKEMKEMHDNHSVSQAALEDLQSKLGK